MQEMANPKVRPHLQFYPEDSGKILEEACQGTRWLEEIPSEQTTPMARIGLQDYFLNEPAMLTNGTCRVPIRWFVRDKGLFAKCWDLEVINTADGRQWRVVKRESEVSQTAFLKNFVDLQNEFQRYDIPDPSKIQGEQASIPIFLG
jgi:rubredoxin